jgi:hypothetical protein
MTLIDGGEALIDLTSRFIRHRGDSVTSYLEAGLAHVRGASPFGS